MKIREKESGNQWRPLDLFVLVLVRGKIIVGADSQYVFCVGRVGRYYLMGWNFLRRFQ